MSSRLMKTLARQGSRYQAKAAWRFRHEIGMSWEMAHVRAAAETLVCVVSPMLSIGHGAPTRRRAHLAALRFTGYKPGAGDYGVVKI